jgi:hypothetical protein
LVIESNVSDIAQAEVIVLSDTFHFEENIQKINAIAINALYREGDVVVVENSQNPVPKDFDQIKFVEHQGKVIKAGDDPIKNKAIRARSLLALTAVQRIRNRTLCKRIEENLNGSNRVFVVFGIEHFLHSLSESDLAIRARRDLQDDDRRAVYETRAFLRSKKFAILCPDYKGRAKATIKEFKDTPVEDPLKLLKRDRANGQECEQIYGMVSDRAIFTTQGPNLTPSTWISTALKTGFVIGALLIAIGILGIYLNYSEGFTLPMEWLIAACISGVALALFSALLLKIRGPDEDILAS